MKPVEAGFDGEKGIMIADPSPLYPLGLTYKLLRGKRPAPSRRIIFNNKLVWHCPEDQDSKLYYVNSQGETFELDFIPVKNPPFIKEVNPANK